MSYEFKKLSEVAALTEVPEGAKVLAEANGQIVRVPGSGLGGSGGGIKTAIIKSSNYDDVLDFLNGKTSIMPDIVNVTFSCVNMTFREVYSAILAGEQVNIVGMFVPEGATIQNLSFIVIPNRILMDMLISVSGTTVRYKSLIWTESGIAEKG